MNLASSNTVHTLSLVTRDHPGVLVRISLTFARRGRNIESLAVSPGATGGYSRMTITSRGNPESVEQIIQHLAKLVDVVDVIDHQENPPLEAEVALAKVSAEGLDQEAVLAHIRRQVTASTAEVIDNSENTAVFRLMGSTAHVERGIAAIAELRPIHELVRSGPVAMDQGASHYAHLMGKVLRS